MTTSTPDPGTWGLREVVASDKDGLDRVADLHMELLDFGPMAALGLRFVRDICYAAHMKDGLLKVWLAEVDGRPAGFVAFTSRSISFHRSGLRNHFWEAGWATARSLIQRPSRIGALVRALKVLGSRRGETTLGTDPLGEVVCVAVRKQYLAPIFMRKSGIRPSELLVRHSARELAKLGVKRMRMIVDADNKPVLMLYHLMGARFENYSQAGEPCVLVWFEPATIAGSPDEQAAS